MFPPAAQEPPPPLLSASLPSPALAHPSPRPSAGLMFDRSLPTALSYLLHHLLRPLAAAYPQDTLAQLRQALYARLYDLYLPTWVEAQPQLGSGFRSLICDRATGLPRLLREEADKAGVAERVWRRVIAMEGKGGKDAEEEVGEEAMVRGRDEWEVWCDPGVVTWRWGGWEWEDPEFDHFKVPRQRYHVLWQASALSSDPAHALSSTTTPTANTADLHSTPSRPSHAIPIRAPALLAVPTHASLLPSAIPETHSEDEREPSRSPSPCPSDASSAAAVARPGGHRLTDSTSSTTSSLSDTNSGHTQLLTPASRPGSTDLFGLSHLHSQMADHHHHHPGKPAHRSVSNTSSLSDGVVVLRGRTPSPHPTPNSTTSSVTPIAPVPTPTVTPYDGGNVTVLGGGVKLGGGAIVSRPSSVMSHHRQHDRSPSISLASRALNTATEGPKSKARTRRRIMPTYLGHLGQPGVGGPIMGPFGQFAGKTQPGQPGMGASVGMGYAGQPGGGPWMPNVQVGQPSMGRTGRM